MAIDVWNMVKTKGINAIIVVGNVEKDVTKIQEANHVWVSAETSPGKFIALETTGGFLACSDSQVDIMLLSTERLPILYLTKIMNCWLIMIQMNLQSMR